MRNAVVHYQHTTHGWVIGFVRDKENPRYFEHPTDASMRRLWEVLHFHKGGYIIETDGFDYSTVKGVDYGLVVYWENE